VLSNRGEATVPIAVYPQHALETVSVKNIDVKSGGEAKGTIPLDPATSAYDVWAHGPNGFLAHAAGDAQSNDLGVEVTLLLTGTNTYPKLRLIVTNSGTSEVTAKVTDRQGAVQVLHISPEGGSQSLRYDPIAEAHGWYDLTLTLDKSAAFGRQFAGHLENGRPSVTG
jgi:phospholipase C